MESLSRSRVCTTPSPDHTRLIRRHGPIRKLHGEHTTRQIHRNSRTIRLRCSSELAAINGATLSSVLNSLKGEFLHQQTVHPVATDAVTAGVLYSASDLFAQWQQEFIAQRAPWSAPEQTPQERMEDQSRPDLAASRAGSAVTDGASVEATTAATGATVGTAQEDTGRGNFEGAAEALGMSIMLGGFDVYRTGRYAVFGLADGGLSHFWFQALDARIEGSAPLDVAAKVATDFALFTPAWCAAFLAYMALTDGAGVRGARERVRKEWWELYKGNVGAWLPANAVLYGAVPLQQRVLAFAGFTLLYTVVLSWWAEDPDRARCRSGAGVCEVDMAQK